MRLSRIGRWEGHHVCYVGNEEMLESNIRRNSRKYIENAVLVGLVVEDTRIVTYPSLSLIPVDAFNRHRLYNTIIS